MSAFVGLTEDLCKRAFEIVQPSMGIAMKRGIVKRSHGFLVVCDSRLQYATRPMNKRDFKLIVPLFSHRIGDKSEWEHPYNEVAYAKAYASWKTGLSSHQIQQEASYLYEHDMAKYGGSAVGPGGLVVAFSGVEEWFDQMFSEMMLAAIKAVCLHEMLKPDGVMADSSVTFIGE